jgi:hypothetical protein
MRLVLADVEPRAIIVGRTPGPVFIDGHKPRIIALAELRQRFRPDLLKYIQVVVSVVALDGLPVFRPASPRFIAASHFQGERESTSKPWSVGGMSPSHCYTHDRSMKRNGLYPNSEGAVGHNDHVGDLAVSIEGSW